MSRNTRVSPAPKVLFALVLALFVSLCGTLTAAPLDGPVDVTLIHTSDVHAHLMPFDCASGTTMGGYARMKAYRDTLVTKGRNVVLLSSGDVFQGTLFYRFYRGIPDVTFMSQMGYAAMAIGNHEFDSGQDGMFEAFRDAKFPILSANLRFGASKALDDLVKPSTIVTVPAGNRFLRIGIIGITDEELEKDVQKVFLKGIRVEDAATALRREIKNLRAQGCDAIFALTHIGWDRDLELADQFPEITGFLGGHTHVFADPPLVRQVGTSHQFVSQPGEFGNNVSRLDLRFEPSADGIRCQVLAAGLVPLTSDMPEDPGIKATVDQLWKKIEEKTSEKLADTVTRLDGDRPVVRRQETNLGNLIADAFVRAMPAQIGLVNGGGIRSSIPAGPVRVADCLNVMPFDNYLARLSMTGATLQKLFEQVRADFLSTPSYGGFMHVSRGFKVCFTPAGVELSYLGRPIEPATVYTVVTNDFLANGGNGLTPFTECLASESSGIICADAMMQHVKALQAIDARVEGRIELQVQPARFRFPAQRLRIPRPVD